MSSTRKNKPDASSATSEDIYERAQKLTTQGIDQLLKSFFSELSKAKFHHLSSRDSERLIAQVKRKQDIIHSSLLFQIKANFADFKASRQFRFQQSSSVGEQILGLVGTNQYTESEELESIVAFFQDKYSKYYIAIAKQLALCIDRPDVDAIDNPLHIKHLCLSFQSAIDTLSLVIAQKVALYKAFSHLVVEQIEPLYISLEEHFSEHKATVNLNPVAIEELFKEEPDKDETITELVPNHSVAISHIPVLIGIFQRFKDKSNHRDDVFSDLLPDLKNTLVQKGINEFDSLIDKLSMFFDIIFSDEDLPVRIKQQLARLQIFIFMSEIQQSGFLVKSSHPARRLIDTIIQTEVDFEKNDQFNRSGWQFLRAEIDKISSNPFIETDYFAYLCLLYLEHTSDSSASESSFGSDLSATATSDSLNLKQEQAEPEKYESTVKYSIVDIVLETDKPVIESIKIDNIYAVVQSIVNDIALPLRMLGKSLILFDEVWFPLLLKVARKQSFKAPAWHKIVTIAKTQAWVLIPKNNQDDLDKLNSTLPNIEKSLMQSMQSLSIPGGQQASLLEFLEQEQQDIVRQSIANIREASQREVHSSEKHSPAQTEHQDLANVKIDRNAETIDEFSNLMENGRFDNSEDMLEALEFDNRVIPEIDIPAISSENIHKGDWIELKKDEAVILAKLTWKDKNGDQYIFVDREGQRVCEISGIDLDRELKEGNISLISSVPVRSQRPAFSIIQTIN